MLATAREDPSRLRALLADDVVWEVGAMQILGGSGIYHGPDGVTAFFRNDSWQV